MAEEKAPKKEKKNIKQYKPTAKFCPKCGSRMADHADRYACGKCGFTEWKEKRG